MSSIPLTAPTGSPKQIPNLPQRIRDALRMTACVRCYDIIGSGKTMKVGDVQDMMFTHFHGKPPDIVSQLQLLCDGEQIYSELYESVTIGVKSKNDNLETKNYRKLKDSLSRDMSRSYYVGFDILVDDLERQHRTGKQLINGRTLLSIAKRGKASYRQCLDIAEDVWDFNNNEPIKSGTNQEDALQYIIRRMYEEKVNMKTVKKCEFDKENDESNNVIEELQDTDKGDDEVEKEVQEGSKGEGVPSTQNTTVSIAENPVNDPRQIVEEVIVPLNWIFPIYMAFVLWGPFVPFHRRLKSFLTGDAAPDQKKSRSEIRKEEATKKNAEREMRYPMGYNMDQKISLASIYLQNKKIKQQQNKLATVNLSMQEQALINLIAAAERMAGYQCRDYNADHPAWKKVNALFKEQEDLFVQMKKQTWAVSNSVLSDSDDDITAIFSANDRKLDKEKDGNLKDDQAFKKNNEDGTTEPCSSSGEKPCKKRRASKN